MVQRLFFVCLRVEELRLGNLASMANKKSLIVLLTEISLSGVASPLIPLQRLVFTVVSHIRLMEKESHLLLFPSTNYLTRTIANEAKQSSKSLFPSHSMDCRSVYASGVFLCFPIKINFFQEGVTYEYETFLLAGLVIPWSLS